jgi:hypothetical protein
MVWHNRTDRGALSAINRIVSGLEKKHNMIKLQEKILNED